MAITLPVPATGPVMNMSAFGASLQQGAHIYILIGGQPVGYITSLQENEDDGTQAFYGLGTIMPQELQPLRWSGTMTISGARTYNASWQSAFMYPGSSILTQGLVNIVKFNKITGAADKVFVGCVPSTFSGTTSANAFSLQNGTWLYQNVQVPGFGL